MKNYLIVDTMGDYKDVADYKDIKDLLIEEVVQDLYNNISDKSLEKENLQNVDLLERLAKEKNTPLSYIEKELECYSFKIIDLFQLQRDLQDIANYFEEKGKINYQGKTDEVVNIINDELCKKEV